jgi:hypothetical protein
MKDMVAKACLHGGRFDFWGLDSYGHSKRALKWRVGLLACCKRYLVYTPTLVEDFPDKGHDWKCMP